MSSIVLNNGKKIPSIGYGTYRLLRQDVAKCIKSALQVGYRHFDCSPIYLNQKEIGMAFEEIFSKGEIKRENVFISSKLWNTFHAKEHVRNACLKTLEDLRLKYLDLFFVHWPIAFPFITYDIQRGADTRIMKEGRAVLEKIPIIETWKEMEKLVEEGLVQSIGVCNFPTFLLFDLISSARIKPAVLEIEFHPYLQQPNLIHLCKVENIAVIGHSTLGGGSKNGILNEPIISKIAKSVNRTPAQVVLRWALQKGVIVIPKSSNEGRMKENLSIQDFNLTTDEMNEIDSLEKGLRYLDPKDFWGWDLF